MEVELERSWDSITDIELWVEDCEAELADRMNYITHLEDPLAKSTATSLCQEGQL